MSSSDQLLLNEVFESYLKSSFHKGTRSEISASYGPDILDQVLDIYEVLIDCGSGRGVTVDTGIPMLMDLAAERYPWLSEKALTNLTHAFYLTWK